MASFKNLQWMITQCILLSLRPANDEKLSRAKWASLLTAAQEHWFKILCAHVPEAQWGPPTQLTLATDRKTATFPEGVLPLGKVAFLDGLAGRRLTPGAPWDPAADLCIEYDPTDEVPIIRAPMNRTFNFANGIYARYADAGDLELAVNDEDPTTTTKEVKIHPLLRMACVYHALGLEASMGGYGNPAYWESKEIQEAWDDPETGKLGAITVLKTQFQDQDASSGRQYVWWRSPDLGNLRNSGWVR